MRSETKQVIKYSASIIALIIIAYIVWNIAGTSPSSLGDNFLKNIESATNLDLPTIRTGTTETGDVAIDLTPVEFVDGNLKIEIGVNTHSVDLNQFELQKITSLEYGGKTIKPISTPALSGHHSYGVLIFETGEDMNTFTITIADIPKVEKRVFEWK